MLKNISFEEYEKLLPRLNGCPVEIGYTNKSAVHISMFKLPYFQSEVFPKKTTFVYNEYMENVLDFYKENIKLISCIDDEDGLCFCITFSDNSYIIISEDGDIQ